MRMHRLNINVELNYYYNKEKIPLCFIQLIGTESTGNTSMAIHSYYNTAGLDGSFMYGGSLDRCQLKSVNVDGAIKYSTDYKLLEAITNVTLNPKNSNNVVSSYPYQLCYCVMQDWNQTRHTKNSHNNTIVLA